MHHLVGLHPHFVFLEVRQTGQQLSSSSSIQPYSRSLPASLPTLSHPKPHPLTVVNPLLTDDVYTFHVLKALLQLSRQLCCSSSVQLTAARLQLLAKQQVRGPQPLHDACFMQIPASELLFFSFSLIEGGNSDRIWRSQELVFVTKWACSTLFQVSLVRQCCCMFLDDSLCMFRVMVKISS